MSKASPAVRSWPSLPDLATIAVQTRLITRESRRFTAAGFLQSLLSSVATGLASLSQIAGCLKVRERRGMARQSLRQRFDPRSTAFLMGVLCDLMRQRYSSAATAITGSAIQRLLIEDSTSQVMPKSNAEAFPAHGNHHGKTAGVKIDLAFDLLTGTIASHSLQAATEQDKTIGKEFIAEVRHGDLVLRDMGYFSLGEFTASQAGAGQLAAIYRARWAVEIQFRAWKQALNLGKALNRKSNEHHLQALALAGMIAHQLGMRIAQRIGGIVGRARLSYEKLYDLLALT